MKRIFSSYAVSGYDELKDKLLIWAAAFEVCCVLDNHNYLFPYHSYECLVGAGAATVIQPADSLLDPLSAFDAQHDDWIFGHLGYEPEKTDAEKTDGTAFPPAFFFVPEVVVQLDKNLLSIGVLRGDADQLYRQIGETEIPAHKKYEASFHNRVSKEQFIETVIKLKEHIQRGDCYEINYCQEFYATDTFIDAADVYRQLTAVSPNPFSCFYRLYDHYALCASPERYVKKEKEKIISQPIKGTAPRDQQNAAHDEQLKQQLQESTKDRRENVIVVDLVRNDLSRVCVPGTVRVEELFGIYTFPTVHQMISTVSGQLQPGTGFSEVVRATFPMGSMTGAPKKRVMELIDQYEKTRRGIYSGTIGYITPGKDFDFNVVIRTIVYNHATGFISYHAGAGITYLSDPEAEYSECLVKAAALRKLFGEVNNL